MAEWRPVVGFEESYEVSDQGEVRSVDRTKIVAGKLTRVAGKLLKPMVQHKGYLTVGLYRGGKRTIRPIHRLVLEAFVGSGDRYQACHINGDRADNRASNLYWGTNSENQRDSVRHGTHRSVRVTECPKGHQYDPVNTYIAPRTGQRVCRECVRAAGREYQRRKRMERAS